MRRYHVYNDAEGATVGGHGYDLLDDAVDAIEHVEFEIHEETGKWPDLSVVDLELTEMVELENGNRVWSWWDAFSGTWRRKTEAPA